MATMVRMVMMTLVFPMLSIPLMALVASIHGLFWREEKTCPKTC